MTLKVNSATREMHWNGQEWQQRHLCYKRLLVFQHCLEKCFLSIKSSYYDFWRIMWHWWCWKSSFDHRNKWHFTIYSHRKQL